MPMMAFEYIDKYKQKTEIIKDLSIRNNFFCET